MRHVILGLPGESHADMLATAREVARLGVDAVKIHNLYAVKRTPLADQVERGEVTLMGRDDYVRTLVDFLELLPPDDDRRTGQRRRPARLLHRPVVVPRQTGRVAGDRGGVGGAGYVAGKGASSPWSTKRKRQAWIGKRREHPSSICHAVIVELPACCRSFAQPSGARKAPGQFRMADRGRRGVRARAGLR